MTYTLNSIFYFIAILYALMWLISITIYLLPINVFNAINAIINGIILNIKRQTYYTKNDK